MNNTSNVPRWLLKNSIYQINPRTFSKEGTVKAVTDELPFLASLGFGTMYLCPIFREDESPDNLSPRQIKSQTENTKNPYRISDYFSIDSEYGTLEDLKEFTNESHRLGMKVILDLVYMHIGPNAPVIAEHPDFVQHNDDGSIHCTEWNFPFLNFENEGLREYLYANMMYYVCGIGVDGFRCDVGDCVPASFWAEARRRMRTVKPEAVLINEGWKAELLGYCFDAMYSFGWHEAMYSVAAGEAELGLLREKWERLHSKMPDGGVAMRDIDTHDTVTDWPKRTELIIGHDGMELIEVLNYTVDGVPMVYCGNELADTKRLSMFANRFHMGDFEVTDRSDKSSPHALRRMELIKALNGLRRDSDVLAYGKTQWVDTELPQKTVCYKRILDSQVVTVIANFSREPSKITLSGCDGEKIISRGAAKCGDVFTFEPFGYTVIYENDPTRSL